MTESTPPTTERISDRYAAMAAKSAGEAEKAVGSAELAANADDPRGAKSARREAKEWCETCTLDAMRAHGALAAETGRFEAQHPRAEEAQKRAIAARDRAADIYRKLKSGEAE